MYIKYLEGNVEDSNKNNSKKIQYYSTFTKKAENSVHFCTIFCGYIITLKQKVFFKKKTTTKEGEVDPPFLHAQSDLKVRELIDILC